MEKQVNRTTDDLISRAEAIEALFDWELCYTWDEHCKEEMDSPYIVSPSSVIDKLPSAQQWHTGEPTESGDYLCYVKYEMTDGGSHEWIEHGYEVCAYYDTDGSFEGDYAGWQSYGIVLAWMPLPQAPEVEE